VSDPFDCQWRLWIAEHIYERAHLTAKFQLRSGELRSEHFDKYRFESDPRLLHEIAQELVSLLPARVDALAGLELGGAPLAPVYSQVSGVQTLFVRKDAKRHGTRQLAEGGAVAGARLAIIEDVITSGGGVIVTSRKLRQEGASIVTVLCVIDRQAGGAANLGRAGLELCSLFTVSELRSLGQSQRNARAGR
jgi:orotate phosphoribosyltransferase